MNEYIDRNELLKTINENVAEAHNERCAQILEAILNAPTADVVEVRHGYWTGMNGDQCSHCGKSLRDLMDGDSYYSSEFEYRGFDALVACPFCGTKMDGERREG